MDQSAGSARRKRRKAWVTVLVTALLALLGSAFLCSPDALPSIVPSPPPAPSPFPETDIVYDEGAKLGFLHADGSDVSTFPFRLPINNFVGSWGRPFITGDNKFLFVTLANYPGMIGHIFGATPGEMAVDCGWTGIAQLAADAEHIFVDTTNSIEKYAPEDCGAGNAPAMVYDGITGVLSADEQSSAGAREEMVGNESIPSIIIRQIQTGAERVVGTGDFPSWSRDGQWLAYTGADGIYIVENRVEAQPGRLVAMESPKAEFDVPVYREYRPGDYFPPIASWSPDGKWLVYHAYRAASIQSDAVEYSIFKVNVKTGETIKLLDGGFSPFWRWPTEGF